MNSKMQYLPKKVRIIEKKEETPEYFTIKLGAKLKHEPGQFIQIGIPGIGEAPISIASYSKDYISLTIRRIGNVTDALSELNKGDYVFIRGPYGKGYPLRDCKGRDIILISGGSGLAPLKSAVEFIEEHRKEFRQVTMFIGFRNADEVLLKKNIKEWIKKYNVNLALDNDVGRLCFNARICFITNTLEESAISPKNKIVFMCGPQIMMKKSIDILKNKGFRENQIYFSAERLMYCGIGVCCHCMIKGKFACKDGPVFRFDKIGEL